jgi:hypothetical protein
MDSFWRDHWWIIIPLAAFTIPLAGIVFSSLNTWMHYRQKREALEVIRTYAAQGKDPPPELIAALGHPGFGAYGAGPAQAATEAAFAFAGDARDAARAARFAARTERRAMRAEFRQWRSPLRRWNQAIFMGALAAGFYGASLYAHYPDNIGRLQIGAIILGALAAAALLSATLNTLIRPK